MRIVAIGFAADPEKSAYGRLFPGSGVWLPAVSGRERFDGAIPAGARAE